MITVKILVLLLAIFLFIYVSIFNVSLPAGISNSLPFGNPLGNTPYTITAGFHDPGYFKIFHKQHTGIDLIPRIAVTGPVYLYSTISGTLYTSYDQCTGAAVLVKNTSSIIYFGHIQSSLILPGSHVNRGDRIAIMGESGEKGVCITGKHVHYQIYIIFNKKYVLVDPKNYLTASFP